jgi:hypothetical protein
MNRASHGFKKKSAGVFDIISNGLRERMAFSWSFTDRRHRHDRTDEPEQDQAEPPAGMELTFGKPLVCGTRHQKNYYNWQKKVFAAMIEQQGFHMMETELRLA